MTIVVTVKVTDGIVLAADSATSFAESDGRVAKVYNNANKIYNLVKVWPIGAMIYGAGSIGSASIVTLSKDLRLRLTPTLLDVIGSYEPDPLALDESTYTVREVAEKAGAFFEEMYAKAYPAPVPNSDFGYRVCGYSAGGALPEAWEIRIVKGKCEGPDKLYDEDKFGPRWAGESEAIDRLILGFGSRAIDVAIENGLSREDATKTILGLTEKLYALLYLPAMPIQDAIDLGRFLVETASKFAHFSMRAATVGGPVEIATITKHEGFKWVARKHFYSPEFNPEPKGFV